MNKKKFKTKLYIESVESIAWIKKNIPTMKESEFIRDAVAEKIKNQKSKK